MADSRMRQTVFRPGGAAPLTAPGVSMILERPAGLDGAGPTPAGLYFAYQTIDHAAYLAWLREAGGTIVAVDASAAEL